MLLLKKETQNLITMKIGLLNHKTNLDPEIRDWFSKNVPSKPLASFDTKEGFEEHREWEKNTKSR